MAEPSLSVVTKDNPPVAYRFLWLRTFHHPIAVRLTLRPDGSGSMIAKVTSGAGGYEPGKLFQTTSFEISKAEVTQFSRLLEKAAFWNLQTKGRAGGNDGAQWILEATNNGVYHIVDMWSPQKTAYSDLCLYLLELSQIKIEANEVY